MKIGKYFAFKQFAIWDGKAGMPVSTDGVLLGAWADIDNKLNILDIGTGTGLLALMCAQRNPTAQITAMDIDANAISAAQANFNRSHWQPRLKLLQGDVLCLDIKQKFSAIICNPPYFTSGQTTDNQSRATARHHHSLPHQALLQRCQQLLTDTGCANFILPLEEGEQFIQQAQLIGFSLKRYCQVKTTANKSVQRLLIELSQQVVPCQYSELTIHAQQGYSAEFIALTQDFYLKM